MKTLTSNSESGWIHPAPKKVVGEKPLGSTGPWCWAVEAVHGCNLRCGHCSCRLLPQGEYRFMTELVWRKTWEVMQAVSPTVRVDIVLGGEPTLHPKLTEFMSIARSLCPLAQIQITTNGTMLLKGKVEYRKLIDAGANIIYTDMYGPRERFKELAVASGVPWYEYYNKPDGAPSPWTYHGPDLRMIVLQEQPENWPDSRKKSGLLGTWYNNLDWEAAARFGLKPVTEPPARRCNQPFIYVPVHVSGEYLLCCQDNMGETAGMFGTVLDGTEGFKRYWYGQRIQEVRRLLRRKNRADISQCKRCNITFSRCDYKHWTDDEVSKFWDGSRWNALPAETEDSRRFELATAAQKQKKKTAAGFGLVSDGKKEV
jgi:hypothetical protein